MKYILVIFSLFYLPTLVFASPEKTLREYLMYIYGSTESDTNKFLIQVPDIWMIPGKKDVEAIALVKSFKINISDPGVYAGIVGRNLVYAEMRDGKIDPTFTLQGIYSIHKSLYLQFIYASLLQNEKKLERIVSNVKNIDFGGAPVTGYGDMDVYAGILNNLPVVRSSDPLQDKKSKSVTYRTPLGQRGFELTFTKTENTWKIDSSNKITVPLEFFFR